MIIGYYASIYCSFQTKKICKCYRQYTLWSVSVSLFVALRERKITFTHTLLSNSVDNSLVSIVFEKKKKKQTPNEIRPTNARSQIVFTRNSTHWLTIIIDENMKRFSPNEKQLPTDYGIWNTSQSIFPISM